MVEGKLKVWIKSGKFDNFSNDLYIEVHAVNGEKKRKMWKTDESDSSKPQWDSTVTKHIKGEYEKLVLSLLDEDTFSKDDLLGTMEVPFSRLESEPVVGDFEMKDKEGASIGTIDISIEYEAGDVNMFQLMASRLHDSDSD